MGQVPCQAKGASGRILSKNPKALYIHCSSHRLNLVIANACEILAVKNMLGQAKKIASFFSGSIIHSQYLSKQIQHFGLIREKLAAPYTTCWVEQITSLDGFLEAFEVIF